MACGRRRGSDRRPETCGACVRLGPPPVRVFLGVPHLKAIVVEPKRSPVVRAHSHGHPLVLRNDRSAGVAGLSDALPMPEFDEGSSWQSAVLDPLSNYFPEERRNHAMVKIQIIGFPGEIVSFPAGRIGKSTDA